MQSFHGKFGTLYKKLLDVISHQIPCLLLDISHPLLGIYGAMNTNDENIICEPLWPILLLHDVHNALISPLVYCVYAAIKSLKKIACTMDYQHFHTKLVFRLIAHMSTSNI